MTNTNAIQKSKTYSMAVIALMAALMSILGPMSIPIGPVPISFTNLVIYFSVYLIGKEKGTISFVLYLLLGIVGLPVFSGYSSGIAKLAGPTGGYLIGFLFMAYFSGLVVEKVKSKFIYSVLGLIGATAVTYLFGTVWFTYQAGCTMIYALSVCVFPFIAGDLIKIVLAAAICPLIKKQMTRAGLL